MCTVFRRLPKTGRSDGGPSRRCYRRPSGSARVGYGTNAHDALRRGRTRAGLVMSDSFRTARQVSCAGARLLSIRTTRRGASETSACWRRCRGSRPDATTAATSRASPPARPAGATATPPRRARRSAAERWRWARTARAASRPPCWLCRTTRLRRDAGVGAPARLCRSRTTDRRSRPLRSRCVPVESPRNAVPMTPQSRRKANRPAPTNLTHALKVPMVAPSVR